MTYDSIIKFAYTSAYLNNRKDIKFDMFDYFNSLIRLDTRPDSLFLDFINFLNKKHYATKLWCNAFKHYWDLNNDRKYVEIFKKYSKLDNESIALLFTHFCSDIINKRIPENEISMENLLGSWLNKYRGDIALEYDFLFIKPGKDDLLFENIPNINLNLPEINNKNKIEELIYALEDIESDDICKSIIKDLKDELSIGLGIDFRI